MTPSEVPSPRKTPLWRLLMEIALALAVIVLAALHFSPAQELPPAETPEPTATAAPTPEPDDERLALRLHGREETETLYFAPGESFVPPDAPLKGYTFLRWQTGKGEPISPAGTPVWESADLYPVYAMKLGREDHAPYLSLDEQGAFHPGDPLTNREVVQALYFLLDTDLVGDGSFLDLPEEDELYPAAATLKQLGILTGSRLHPEETVTRREFLGMLCTLFPQGSRELEFSDLSEQDADYELFRSAAQLGWIESGPEVAARPDEELTRLEFVSILSAAMDRHGDKDRRTRLVGTILDVRSDDPHFWDVAESVIVHHPSGDGEAERWARSEALPSRQEGFFFLGTDLHAIDAGGDPVVNGSYEGISFDQNGVVTSGDAELDSLIRELLPTIIDPSAMTREEMLSKLFYFPVAKLRYHTGNYYIPGEPAGWEIEEAKLALRSMAGNCYDYAAAFCVLARAVGYPAQAYTGSVFASDLNRLNVYTDIYGEQITLPEGRCPHGWVEIPFDGQPLIFDPEMVFRLRSKGNYTSTIYMDGEETRVRYGYSTQYEPPASPSPVPSAKP